MTLNFTIRQQLELQLITQARWPAVDFSDKEAAKEIMTAVITELATEALQKFRNPEGTQK